VKKFFAYDGVNGQLWVSSDAGASFHKGVGYLPPVPSWLPQDGNVTAVSGHEGDLWICTGDGGLYRSINSGGNAVNISSVSAAYRMRLGASATPGGYLALYLFGTVNGALGFFRSHDFGASWTRI
jgi:xyloglucan-specific exo-beta-1,4-glucanase